MVVLKASDEVIDVVTRLVDVGIDDVAEDCIVSIVLVESKAGVVEVCAVVLDVDVAAIGALLYTTKLADDWVCTVD